MANGIVITFYSYKGGVGRSFALANIGALLSKWGYKVLCVDWDLESPGLFQYFEKYLSRGNRGNNNLKIGGVVEYIETIRAGNKPNWKKYITKFNIPSFKEPISLMVAGEQNESYTERLGALEWKELYTKHKLGKFLEEIRTEWKKNYDFILIDSRTGVTDIGGISTIHFPDIFVFFFTANYQSLDGAVNVAKRIFRKHKQLPYDRGGLITLPLLSRFDMREEYEQGKEWLRIVEDKVKTFYRDWLHKQVSVSKIIDATTVPYMSYWSFGEKLAVVEDPRRDSESINYRLETIAALFAQQCSETLKLTENRDSFVSTVSKEELTLKRKQDGEKSKLKEYCEKILHEGNILEWRKLVKRLWRDIPERILEWKPRAERSWKEGSEEQNKIRIEAVEICLPCMVPIFIAVENGRKDLWEEAIGSLRQLALLRERMGGGIVDVIEIGGHMLYIAGSLGMAIAARTNQLDFINNWMSLQMPATNYWEAGDKTWAEIRYAHRLWGKYLSSGHEPFNDLWNICKSEYISNFFTDKKLLEKYLFLANLAQSMYGLGSYIRENKCVDKIKSGEAETIPPEELIVWPVWVQMKHEDFKSGTWELFRTSEGILKFVFPESNITIGDFWAIWKWWKTICVKPMIFKSLLWRGMIDEDWLMLPGEPTK